MVKRIVNVLVLIPVAIVLIVLSVANRQAVTLALNPFRPGETLSLTIWASRTEAVAPNAAQIADISSAVLILMVFAFCIGSRIVGRALNKRLVGENC